MYKKIIGLIGEDMPTAELCNIYDINGNLLGMGNISKNQQGQKTLEATVLPQYINEYFTDKHVYQKDGQVRIDMYEELKEEHDGVVPPDGTILKETLKEEK